MNRPLPYGSLLSRIDSPKDLRGFSMKELSAVSEELRQFIIDNVSVYGGHFGASLGVVELTLALHYVFDTPRDLLVWDVGHQAYGHKILTGRRDLFHTNRVKGGLSGFPSRSESPYDVFGVGHSSTSISAALGMSIASHYKGDSACRHIAVIGDGAMTAGMAFEAMNHVGASQNNLLIVLNDNCMSIDPNVGALKEYLTSLTLNSTYNKWRNELDQLLPKFRKVGRVAQGLVHRLEHSLKGIVTGYSNFFESLNVRYFGPVDGHNLSTLVGTFNSIKDLPGPKILHCLTVKGKGFRQAEQDQTHWHAPGAFDKLTGKASASPSPGPLKYQEVFGHVLLDLARTNEKIIGITPAMPTGSSMTIMMKEFPERVFDVGIAEQHAVTFSAGLASQGLVPFCHIYSTFLQRAYDQVIHDVCIQSFAVNFILDRAGLVGEDGPTHHGAFDMAYLRCLPGAVIAAPMNEVELAHLLYSAQRPRSGSPWFIRYPRGKSEGLDWRVPYEALSVGKGRCICAGKDIAVVSIGTVGNVALGACEVLKKEGISLALYDLRFLKPLDTVLLDEIFARFEEIITIEDGCLAGGMGSAVLEYMVEKGYHAHVKRLGIPDIFVPHGKPKELYTLCGYDEAAICVAARQMMGTKYKEGHFQGKFPSSFSPT